jgi:hypothetical protein
VNAVVKVTGQFRKADLISNKQRLQIFLDAVKSDCGRKLSRKRKGRHVAATTRHLSTLGEISSRVQERAIYMDTKTDTNGSGTERDPHYSH